MEKAPVGKRSLILLSQHSVVKEGAIKIHRAIDLSPAPVTPLSASSS